MLTSWNLLKQNRTNYNLFFVHIVITIITICVGSLYILNQQVTAGIKKTTAELVGSDLVISSPYEFNDEIYQYLATNNIKYSKLIEFPSMLRTKDNNALVIVKVLDKNYPLKGKVELVNTTNPVPAPSNIWLNHDARIRMNVTVGDKVSLGASTFIVSDTIISAPTVNSLLANAIAQVCINAKDLQATQLLQFGSRVDYKLLLVGSAQQIKNTSTAIQALSRSSYKIQTADNVAKRFFKVITYGKNFISCVIIATMILSITALWYAISAFFDNELDNIATLQCLGLENKMIKRLYFGMLAYCNSIYFVAGVIGSLSCSWLLTKLAITHIMPIHFFEQLNIWPLAMVIATTILCYACISYLTANYNLHKQLYRHAYKIVALPKIQLPLFRPQTIFFALWNTIKDIKHNAIIYGILTITLTGIFLILLIGLQSLNTWQSDIGEKTPNYFVTNIDDKIQFTDVLTQANIATPDIFPIVQAEIVKKHGKNFAWHRPLQITWDNKLPNDNTVVAGNWPNPSSTSLSIEQAFAKTLNVRLNDTITLNILGEDKQFTVTSIRAVDWLGLTPNFYFILHPDALADYSPSYMASLYISEATQTVQALVNNMPNITLFSVNNIIDKAKIVLTAVTKITIFFWLLFISIAGVLLLLLGKSILDNRLNEFKVLILLGMHNSQVINIVTWEFLLITFAAMLTAAGVTVLSIETILSRYFNINFNLIYYTDIAVTSCVIIIVLFSLRFFLRRQLWQRI
jgi:putative ABC transport system permease protein